MTDVRHLVVLACGLVACSSTPPPTCAVEDLDCFMDQLSFRDAAGATVHIDLVDTDTILALATATSNSPSVPFLTSGPPSLNYPYGTLIDGADVIFTDPLDLTFTDPNGCQPVVALTLTNHGNRSTHTGCFPGLHDMKKAGTITSNVGFTATAATETNISVELRPISSTDCTSINAPADLVKTASAVANLQIIIPVNIAPPLPDTGSGSETCPGGLLVSTLDCDPLGSGGEASYCLSATEFMTATGMPLPSACYPAGTTGCEGESGSTAGTLVKPCCPGLTCKVGSACGDPTGAVGGSCQ
jgi:hypothetical protein